MSPRVVVFAKPPVPGRVKTRLIPALGAAGAAALHRAMAEDVVALCQHAGLSVTVALDGPLDAAWARELRGRGCALLRQVQGDLGARMLAALGQGPALALGVDSPTLPAELLLEAAELRSEVTLGPAFDGGYWLLAWRSPHPQLLSNMPWSTEAVFAETVERCTRAGLGLHRLPFWYDVDTPPGLDFLRQHLRTLPPSVAVRTRAALALLPA